MHGIHKSSPAASTLFQSPINCIHEERKKERKRNTKIDLPEICLALGALRLHGITAESTVREQI